MAYGIIYKLRAETQKYKDDVKINILKLDYAGTQYDKYLGAGGVTLTKDDAGVICGTSLSFTIQADTDFEYLNFFESDPREYLVQLLINDVIKWQGYLIGDEYREAFRNPPYDVQVTATDGLGLLKNYPYTVLSTPATKTTRIDVARVILENTGLDLNISVAYGAATAGGVNLFNVEFADDYYEGWTCYEVLEKMIPPDATITQHNNVWLIRRNEQDSESTPKIYSYVDGVGYTITNGTAETVQTLAAMGSGDVYPIGQAELNMQHAWASVELFSEHAKRPSFLYNHDFSNGLDQWTEGPATGYVEVWNSGDGSYVKITGEHTPTSEDVPEVYVKQSFPYTAVAGEDFLFSMRYCANGYLALLGVGIKRAFITIKGRVEYTDGVTTYYLDETEGWSTTNRNFEHRKEGNIGPISWTDYRIITKTPPLASGTMTVYLYGYITDPNAICLDVNFTDVVVHPLKLDEYPDSYRYDIAFKDGATDRQTVTILPTSAPDVANFDRMFYNGQTVSGSRMDAFVSGGNTYTFTNLILNSLKFLHGTTRQLLQGYFRGSGLSLNSVIGCAATDGRKYFVESGVWEVLNDKLNLNLLEIPGTASGSSWAVGTTDFATSAEWSNNTSSGSGSSETISGGGGGGSVAGGSWLDPYFELVNPGTTGEYLRALRDFASTGEIVAYNTVSGIESNFVASFLDLVDTPDSFGTSGQFVVVNAAGNGLIFSDSGGGSASGVSDHGLLSGLGDDDHPHYFNQTRGDARYQLKDDDLTSIAAIGSNFGFLKKTAANTWGIDPSVYLTSESDPVFAAASGAFSTTGHNHNSLYLGISAKAADSDKLDGHDSTYFAVASHNHSGVYEPAFSKNTAFNKNFGSASGDVCQGNDARLSDSRTPLSHTHGNLTNDGKIGVISGKPIITAAAGALTAGSFGTTAGTFAVGNDSRFHTHPNSANLDVINQDLATDDDVHFASVDVDTLEVDTIIDGVLQTGYGANLLKYSSLFENEVWNKVNCTASDNNADNPFGGNTVQACFLMVDSTSPVLQQEIANSTTGVHVFSIWVKSAGTNDTVNIRTYSNTQSASSTPVSVTTLWQRVFVTLNFTAAHAKKYVRIDMGTQDLYIWGAQLEAGSTPTRHINTGAAGAIETGAHVYGDLRVAGSIVASDDVTAYSDARLKHDVTPTEDLIEKVRKIRVVDYKLNGDRSERPRTGIIAQDLIEIFPKFVHGSYDDYYSINYGQMTAVCIKAIQELADRVDKLEKMVKG